MAQNIHFISGLPRSGSTLLSGILRQNPRIHAHISSPVAAMFGSLQIALSGRSEYYSMINDRIRQRMLRGLFENYYADIWCDKIILDTNRAWTSKLAALLQLFPDAKAICCVRPLPWVIDSFERLVRENSLEPSKIYNFRSGGNIYTRSEHLNAAKGVIGSAYQNLRGAFYGPHSAAMILVPYDVLTRAPEQTLAHIYRFLGIESFQHDFDNVDIEADEFDRMLGTPRLHQVNRKVQMNQRAISVPPDLIKKFAQSQFWIEPGTSKACVLTLRHNVSTDEAVHLRDGPGSEDPASIIQGGPK